MTDSTTRSGENATTVYAALEVSGRSWILAVGDPSDAPGAGLHGLEPHDVDGPAGKAAAGAGAGRRAVRRRCPGDAGVRGRV